jgi:hypothetical protein
MDKRVNNKPSKKPYKFPTEINGIKILKHLPFEKGAKRFVIAECPYCKEEWKARMDLLVAGGKSCKNCKDKVAAKKRVTHGYTKHPLYNIWADMKARCNDKNQRSYKWYKDVKICSEWKNDAKAFIDWALENGWEKGLHLDKDIMCSYLCKKEKIYSPETCMFIKAKRNRSLNSNPHSYKKECKVCGKEYYGTKRQLYCSLECQHKENYRRQKEKRRAKRIQRQSNL